MLLSLGGGNSATILKARAFTNSGHALGAAAQLPGHLALRVPARHVLTLIPRLLTAGQRGLHLALAPGEVQRERHERQVPVADLADQRVDFPAVQQQLAVTPRRMVGPAAVVVF